MSDHVCDKLTLKAKLEIVKSPTGINAVWNKDDNTVYYNSKIFNEEEKELFFLKKQKQLNKEESENNNTNYRGIPPNKIREEHKDLYRAVRQSRIECCSNCPTLKEV